MQFSYKAKQGPQKIVEGFVEADSVDAAVAKVVQSGLIPLDVSSHAARGQAAKPKSSKRASLASPKVPAGEIALFTRQVSDLLDAGVPVLKTLNIVGRQTKHPALNAIIQEMALTVKDGAAFSSALASYPRVFPKLYANLVKSGELGGQLSAVFNRLADYLEKDQETRSQIKTSLLYPSVILTVGVAVIFVLFTWIIPKITVIFEDLSESLPWPTVVLMSVSQFFSRFWWVMIGAVVLAVGYLKRLRETPQGKLWFDQMILKLPLVGAYRRDAEIGRFARTLATLLDNGVVIVTALESVALVIDNEIFKAEIKRITQEVTNGSSLAGAVKSTPLFPETAVNIIAVAEETGETEKGLYKLAEFYERQTQKVMKIITSSLEPALILTLGLVVGFVVIGMLMPIFRMNLIVR